MTRRQFGSTLLAGAGGLAVTPAFGAVEIGVQSYTFRRFDVDKMIAAMNAVGLKSVELWDGHLDPMKATEADFKAVKKKFADAGIRVSAYCVNFPVSASDEYLDRGFGGALLLGTSVMTASVKKQIVPRLDQWCQKYKVRMGLHNHYLDDAGYKRIVKDRAQEFEGPQDFLDALKGASRYMAVNLDIGHFSAAGHDPVAFLREHHRRIVSLHIKDRDRDPARTYRRFGQGATPIVETMKLARKINFGYVANIEYEIESEDPTEGVRHAYEYLKRI